MAPKINIIGAGIMGLSLAWELRNRGAELRIFERDAAGAGASGGIVGALAPHAPETWTETKEAQLESLLMAEAHWRGVEAASGIATGYARTGRVQPLIGEHLIERAHERARGAERLWRGPAVWEIRRAEEVPGLRLASELVVYDTLSARISPRLAVQSLVGALAVRGVRIERGEGPEGEGVTVWANGFAGLQRFGLGLAQKGQAALLAADWRDAPQISAPGLHIVPHSDGTLAIGSTSENQFDDPTACDGKIDAVIAAARALCPELAEAPVIERWAGIRPRPFSRQPILGALPDREGEYVFNGGFKIGFGIAPIAAKLMADLLLEGTAKMPAEWRL